MNRIDAGGNRTSSQFFLSILFILSVFPFQFP